MAVNRANWMSGPQSIQQSFVALPTTPNASLSRLTAIKFYVPCHPVAE